MPTGKKPRKSSKKSSPSTRKAARTSGAGSTAKAVPGDPPAGAGIVASGSGPGTQPVKSKTVLYVHGVGNKPIPSILKCQWDHALFGFDVGERSRLAYWVSREHYPQPLEATCKSGDKVALEDEPTGEGISLKQHLEETPLEAEVEAVTDDEDAREGLLRIASEIERHDDLEPAGLRALHLSARASSAESAEARGVEAKILPLPEFVRRFLTRKLTRALLRDVNDFLFVPELAERMRDTVRERLRAGGGPFVVIGHSQGSMIAYTVLCEEEFRGLDVTLFVTIGSPLGIQEVQDQLRSTTGLRVPTPVARWLNVADPFDPIALDKNLSNDFAANDRGVRIEDVLEFNADSPFHPHSGTGYLRTAPVRLSVRAAVDTGSFQPVADFTIARDVVRRLENNPADARHEVLIQLADVVPGSTRTLADARREVVSTLESLADASGVSIDILGIEKLERFVAAELTRPETEQLAHTMPSGVRVVGRIWRNSIKRALLDVSVRTVQALPAHLGYQALGRGIEWAVLDTGIAKDHPHFRPYDNIAAQYDCSKSGKLGASGSAPDRNGHGTHVAGIIAGTRQFDPPDAPPRVVSGLAPAAKLHVYKVLANDGTGRDSWIIKALDHIAETNAKAGALRIHGVNLSLGGPFDQSVFGCGHTPLCDELRRLWQQGVVVVLAAGNEGFAVLESLDGPIDANMDLSIGDPANLEEAIAVGSVHKERPHTFGVSFFSSRGPTADGRQKPDLVAPGEKILSCRHDAAADDETAEALYLEMSGTSMAAPHVSGMIAAFLSVRREFIGFPDRVKRILLESCTDLARDRAQQGAGLPNLTRMLLNT